ncbi:Tetraacyldisaccharide 4'-kinase [Emticicia aquatica]|uniref:Tetraacyldisaccharide 4'-kinase n=1 Tax=Emticicia aquatica TaxID=1681835 RepID=A0ABM9AKE0_9BACT|nr:tetraacyldisaccharide 4'-kinase [Emticicia aquatica]CAH0994205.1 Tetraacyldisaccharide 4'-kinase [Emticicia aquatica]
MKFVFFTLKVILYPLMLLINIIIYSRNWLYDNGFFKSVRTNIFTINVGNLNLGGTGKTPHVEYLVRLLLDKQPVSILSRGYKRKTKGFILADENATAESIGDEPMQYFSKFNGKVNVVVCEDRVAGVNKIESLTNSNQVVILDDAFQHRKIAPHLNLLLCDYNRPFYEDFLVPIGRLRDVRTSAKRADAVIVTKCPNEISSQNYKQIKSGISKYILSETPIFFSRILYKPIRGYSEKSVFNPINSTSIITGIAKPEIFVDYILSQNIEVKKVHNFADHYAFSRKDIDKIIVENTYSDIITQMITTEKDMVKLKPLLSEKELNLFFYVPIEIEIEDKKVFDDFILGKLK